MSRRKKETEVPLALSALTIATVAERLACSTNAVWKVISKGHLKAFKGPGGWRVTYTEFKRYFKELTGED